MDAMKPSCPHTSMDTRPGETGRSKLPAGDDAVLPLGDFSDLQIRPVAFASHMDTKATGG
jgi:hypothetical protein